MFQLSCKFLGQFEVVAGSEPMTDFHSDKARALLAYLALEPQRHMRRTLASLLWPEIADKHALANLRNTLHRLRQTLNAAGTDAADQLLVVTRHAVQFNAENAFVDVLQFQTYLDSASNLPTDPQAPSSSRLGHLSAAISLYQGELLSGFSIPDASAFEEWLLMRRESLQQRTLLTISMTAAGYESQGDYEQAYVFANKLLLLDSYREDVHRQVMRLLARMGQPEQALRHFEQMRQLFHTELNVAPSEPTLALVKQITTGEFDSPARGQGDTATTLPPAPVDVDASVAAPSPTPDTSPVAASDAAPDEPAAAKLWSEAPEPGPFFGRREEQAQLEQWLIHDRCRVVAVLGIGGIGKTTLAIRCVWNLANQADDSPFDAILWRSLLNAPPLTELLPPLLQILSDQQLGTLPESLDEQLQCFLLYLRQKRVLLVLDNMESILDADKAGTFRAGYEPYGQLIQQFATHQHQSHLLITSRERPQGYTRLEGDTMLVRSLQLAGLDDDASNELLEQRGIHGKEEEAVVLIHRCSGNPLALKLVADTVGDIFGGNIAEFLTEESLVFDDVRSILDQQFTRLTPLEQEMLFWLAVEREPTPPPVLRKNLLQRPGQRDFVEALRSLQRRSLIERHEHGFALQNVITEYLTDRLIGVANRELETGEIDLLHRQALVKAQAKEYVRQSQSRMLLDPVGQYLLARFGRVGLTEQLQAILNRLRAQAIQKPGYAPGTILNLMVRTNLDITGADFSRLAVWQAYLRNARLPAVNFAYADFAQIALADTFGDVRSLAFSPNGQLVAAGTAAGEVSLWSTADTQMIAVLDDDAAPIWAVGFHPNNRLLASGGTDHILRLWDVASGQVEKTLLGHTKTIRAVAFSPDGTLLASSGDDRTACLWNVASGQLLHTLDGDHKRSVRSVSFSPDGTLLACGSEDCKIQLWDVNAIEIRHTLLGHSDGVRTVAFSPNGRLLASCSYDYKVLLWDVNSGEIRHTLLGHNRWVESIAFSPDGKLLASGGDDKTVRLWDVASGALLNTLLGHSGWVNEVAFSPDGKTLVSGDDDRNIFLWDVESQRPHYRLLGHLLSVESVDFSPDGQFLVCGIGDQTLRFWRLSEDEPAGTVRYVPTGQPVHVGHVTVVAFSSDGKTVASGTADRVAHLVDADSEQIQHTLAGHRGWIKSVAFSNNGEILASGSTDMSIRLWDVASGKLRHTIDGHSGWVNGLAFSPNDQFLASAAGDAVIYLWNVQSGEHRQTFTGHVGWVNDVAFALDGRLLISAGADQTVRLWDTRSGQLLETLEGHTGWVWKTKVTADGSVLASGGHDRTVRMWDISNVRPSNDATGNAEDRKTPDRAQLQHTLPGHSPWVTDIALNSRDRILASSSGKQTIRLWHIDSGKCIQTLKIPGLYEGMNITGVTGITDAQRATLKALGAVETSPQTRRKVLSGEK